MNRALARRAACVALNERHKVLNERFPARPLWTIWALPYLEAIAEDYYGTDDPTTVVLYALSNLSGWRGETARQVKLQLNEAIK